MFIPETAYQQVERLVKKFKNLSPSTRRAYNEDNTRKDFILPLFHALEWEVDNAAEVSAEEKVSRGWVDYAFRIGGIPRFFLETKKIAEDLTKPEWVRQAIDYAWTKSVVWALLSDFEGLRVFNTEVKEFNPLAAQFIEFSVDTYLSDFERLWWLSRPETVAGTLDRQAERWGKKTKKEPVSQHLFDDLKTWRAELYKTLRAYNPHRPIAQIDEAVLRILNRLIFIRTAEDRLVEQPRLLALLRDMQKRGGKAYQELPRELAKLFREMDAVYNSDLFSPHFSEDLECEPEPYRILIEGLYEKPGSFVRYNFNALDADVLGTAYEQYLGHVVSEEHAPLLPQSNWHVEEKRQKRKSQGIYYTPMFVVKYIVQQTLGRRLQESSYHPAHPPRVLDMACGSGSFLIEAFDVLDRYVAHLRGDDTPLSAGEGLGVRDYARRVELLTQCVYGVDKDHQAVDVARLNLDIKALHAREKLPMLANIRCGDSLISGTPEELQAAFGDGWREKRAFNWEREFPEVFQSPPLPLWLITFVTHNSRVSERMVEFGIKTGEPLIFSPEDQILIARKIAEACQKNNIPIVAWNVLPDHIHMVIPAANENELEEAVRNIKGYSSFAFQRERQWEKGQHVWAQKFNRRLITDEQMLHNVMAYVQNNHLKHAEQWGDTLGWDKGLKPLVSQACVPVEEAIRQPGGFDIIIGNPPYVRQETLGSEFKAYAQQKFATYAGMADLYIYFIEQAHKLLKPGGYFGMIVSNKWMRSNYGKALRQFLTAQSTLLEIIDFGELPVFQDAATFPVIIITRKQPTEKQQFEYAPIKRLDFVSLPDEVRVVGTILDERALHEGNWTLASDKEQAILEKVRRMGIPLGEYTIGKVFFGIKTGHNKAFVITRDTRDRLVAEDSRSAEHIRPFVVGDDVRKYHINFQDTYLICIPKGWTRTNMGSALDAWRWFEQTCPAIAKHLRRYASEAEKRQDQGDYWWELRACDYYSEFEKPKIVYPDIAKESRATFDTDGFYFSNTVYFIPLNDLYLLALLNSKLIFAYFKRIAAVLGDPDRGGRLRWFRQDVMKIPIRRIDFAAPADKAQHDALVKLVEEMLALQKEHAAAECEKLDMRHTLKRRIDEMDAEIDRRVYELYALTEEEIRVVEGG